MLFVTEQTLLKISKDPGGDNVETGDGLRPLPEKSQWKEAEQIPQGILSNVLKTSANPST